MTALVVLNYNDYETTSGFVKSIMRFGNLDKIIIVDNNSTDGSYDALLELQNEKIDVIRTEKNGGYASGNNRGCFYAISKYNVETLIIANPDIEITEETIAELLQQLNVLSDVGQLSCKMVCTSEIKLPIASRLPKYIDCVLENFIILRKICGNTLLYSKNYLEKEVVQVDVVPGSFFVIPAEVFVKVDGFDGDTFLYYEENILSYKLKEAGYHNYLLGNLEYIHKHSVSVNKNISSVKKRLDISQKSREVYCKKCLKVGNLGIWILRCAYKIGLFNYLFAIKVTKKKR